MSDERFFQPLRNLLGKRLSLDLSDRRSFETDFGRWRFQTPRAVARCQSSQEVAEVVRFCFRENVPIAARGQGHTQSGQSLSSGLLLDTSEMQRILEINTEEGWVDCQAGVVWGDLVAATSALGYLPPVLTNNLSVTVGGTLSVAGLGVASFRYGSQADQALEVECVTGDGEIHVCSPEQEPELFDMVRCSLGQIAVVTRVKTRLRRAPGRVRQYTLIYDELGRFMEEAVRVMDPSHDQFSSLGGICSPAPLGMRKIGEGLGLGRGMLGYALWLFPMYVTVEYEAGQEPNDSELLGFFHPWRLGEILDLSRLEFARRMEPMFEAWKLSGYWDQPHPWMETILPWANAEEYVTTVLANLPPGALGPGGHVLLWPARTAASSVPLLVHPEGDFLLGWGVLGSVPPEKHHEMLVQLEMASELSIAYGAKRYLSGYITFDTPERWAAHFGPQWDRLRTAKRRYDPAGILRPGWIQFG